MAADSPPVAACQLTWLPDSLYNSCVSAVATNFTNCSFKGLPQEVQFDIYMKLYKQGQLCQLGVEMCDLSAFDMLLRIQHRRHELFQCFQALINHGLRLHDLLVNAYGQRCFTVMLEGVKGYSEASVESVVQLGLRLGSFLIECGWFKDGERCVKNTLGLCQLIETKNLQLSKLECFARLLETYNGYYQFSEAFYAYEESKKLVTKLQSADIAVSLTLLYTQYSLLFYNTSRYDEAEKWALESLRQITESVCRKAVIIACRNAAKVLTVRRRFDKAETLIKHALVLSKHFFDNCRLLPETLQDFGFYLMNVDRTEPAVQVYQEALDYAQNTWVDGNIKLAQAHEELAYVLYVYEYSSGGFLKAREHAEKAIEILGRLVPNNHLLFCGPRRVKALILEEMAIDSPNKIVTEEYLQDAEDLHTLALNQCKKIFGDDNIQTAKHYGNLGRLYQSMQRFKEAEEMHLRAIRIKEKLLGENDYEVALSVGHLASLYNYDLLRFAEAEGLYLRSAYIGKLLFGPAYSGLEYDYRGLIRVYSALHNHEKTTQFVGELHRWKTLRDAATQNHQFSHLELDPLPDSSVQFIRDFLANFSPPTKRD